MKRRERSRLVRLWRLFRSRNPRTFTEKVRYKMLRDHRELLVTFADKVAVRQYVADAVGARYLPAVVGVYDDPAELRGLPAGGGYVVKPTHGSGAVIVVSQSAPPDKVLVRPEWGWVYQHVRPEHADPELLARTGALWLRKLYGQGPNREWAYGRVTPRIIVEEQLAAEDGSIPEDFKFFVFHQKCRYIQVDAGRFGYRTQDFHLPTWEHLPMSGGPPWAEPRRRRPERLDEMIALAERLGAGTDFVRVDLYHLPERVVVGELTSYPAGGQSPFDPPSFDSEFGSHWRVPRRYR